MNSTGDIFALRGRRKYLLVSQIAHTVLYRLHSGACQTHTGRGTHAWASWLLVPGLKKFENLVPTCGFHYENLKSRKNTGTLLPCVKESVH